MCISKISSVSTVPPSHFLADDKAACLLSGVVFRIGGKSTIQDFALAAEVCLPIISSMLAEIKKGSYPRKCFLNVDVPTEVANHKVLSRIFFIAYNYEIVLSVHLIFPTDVGNH